MGGFAFPVIAWSHSVAVIITLLWLPYGKLLHIFQRSARVAHMVNAASEVAEPKMATCGCCGKEFAPLAQIEDLKAVTARLGMSYQFSSDLQNASGGTEHYQHIYPFCRRALLVQSQGRRCQSAGVGPLVHTNPEAVKNKKRGVEIWPRTS